MRRKFFIVMFAIGWVCNVIANTKPDVIWSKGAVVLADKQVLTGEICVQGAYDLVLFKNEEKITVLPSHKLYSLRIYDQQANINRSYISQPSIEGGMTTHHIYEVVVHGTISVLRRQHSFHSSKLSDALDFDYYVFTRKEMVRLQQFREKVYPAILASGDVQVSAYVKDEHLNPNLQADAIRIIQFYNKGYSALFSPQVLIQ